ncbi:T-box transcription factor TBX6L-like protein [Labeo rohita]|uniref:T-box transcription factor TBX6L-like protein n=1 Tax=Labeo rohita TaxID=84645 RepID=A0A498MZ52_LABRO|nr:T-box transcription factor TBX6L-like protein [Labeo rohita]
MVMYLPEERPVLDLPYQMNHLANNYGYYPQDCKEPICRTQHGLNGRMNSPEAELTSLPVHVSLQDRELWDKFSNIGTEMLITKSGRRMFPSCKVTVTGMNPKVKYVVIMDMVPFDNHKYKWSKDRWEGNGSTDPHLPNRFFIHPDSPAPGEKWMQYPISFHKLKLTNNTLNSNGLVVLHSMHKYQPRLHIVQSPDPCNPHNPGGYLRFTFPEAAFIAVTAYQNQEITKLKIDNNPFAKGFRDNGLNRKRFRDNDSQETQDSDGQAKQDFTPNEHVVGQPQKDEDVDVTVSSSVDCSRFLSSSEVASSVTPNPFISAFINPSTAGGPSPHQNHTILSLNNSLNNSHLNRLDSFVLQNNGFNFFPSPREARSSSLHSLCAALPVAQSSCVQTSTVDLSRLPSQISSPLNPQQHHHHSSPASQTPGRSIIQLQPYFRTTPHPSRQCPDMELPLPLPPKLSRMQLPESALRNLEMTPVSDYVNPRPLTDILNRIHFRALASGPSGKVLQNPPQPEQYLRGSDRELRPQIYPAVHEYIDQQFTLNSMLNSQTEHRSQMDYANAKSLTEYYCEQQTRK